MPSFRNEINYIADETKRGEFVNPSVSIEYWCGSQTLMLHYRHPPHSVLAGSNASRVWEQASLDGVTAADIDAANRRLKRLWRNEDDLEREAAEADARQEELW